jgi:hypothetical protein
VHGTAKALVAVVVLVLATACSSGSSSLPSSAVLTPAGSAGSTDTVTASSTHVWVPADGYVTEAELESKLVGLIAPPARVTSSTAGRFDTSSHGCFVPSPRCSWPSYGVVLQVTSGSATAPVSVAEQVEDLPDVGVDPCQPAGLLHPTPGYHCVTTTPWVKTGDAWVSSVRTGETLTDCRQESVVRRGRSSVTVTENLSAALCTSSTPSTDLAVAVPLSADEVQALALAVPLVQDLFRFVAVATSPPDGLATPPDAVPVRAFWRPVDGFLTQGQFAARVVRSLPSGVTGGVVGPSDDRPVPCQTNVCWEAMNTSGQRTVSAALDVIRDGVTGLLVLGEDRTSGSENPYLRTCLGFTGCTQLVPWTKHGDAWTAVFENVNADTGLIDRTAYVVRGSSAFGASSQTQVLHAADDTLETLHGVQPVLTAQELLTLVTSLPLGTADGAVIRHGKAVVHRPGPTSFTGVIPCRADLLNVEVPGPEIPGKAGTSMMIVTKRGATCLLTGTPTVLVRGASPLPFTYTRASGGTPILLGPVAIAVAAISRPACSAGLVKPLPTALDITLPGISGSRTVSIAHALFIRKDLQPCAGGTAEIGNHLRVSAFEPYPDTSWPGPL